MIPAVLEVRVDRQRDDTSRERDSLWYCKAVELPFLPVKDMDFWLETPSDGSKIFHVEQVDWIETKNQIRVYLFADDTYSHDSNVEEDFDLSIWKKGQYWITFGNQPKT